DLREIVAWETGVRIAAARRAQSGYCENAGRASPARGRRRISGGQRNRSNPALHAPFHLELCNRSGHVSARVLHHEVQPARERIRGAAGWPCDGTSLPITGTFPGLPEDFAIAGKVFARN